MASLRGARRRPGHSVIIEVRDLDDKDGIQRTLLDGLPGAVLLESEVVPDSPA